MSFEVGLGSKAAVSKCSIGLPVVIQKRRRTLGGGYDTLSHVLCTGP